MALSVSDDGKSLASLGADTGGKTVQGEEVKGSAKVFDVENFGGFGSARVGTEGGICELTIQDSTHRHDQHPQASLLSSSLLLGARKGRRENAVGDVRFLFCFLAAPLKLTLPLLANSTDFDSSAIRIYDGRGDGTPLHTLATLHRQSVHLMAVSLDERTRRFSS